MITIHKITPSDPSSPAPSTDWANRAAEEFLDGVKGLVVAAHGTSSESLHVTQANVMGDFTDLLTAIILRHASASPAQSEDKARLDWLEKTEHDVVFEAGDLSVGIEDAWQVWNNARMQRDRPCMKAFSTSLRAAIDSARAATKGESET